MSVQNNPGAKMHEELRQLREEAKTHARSGGHEDVETEELPEGTSPIEARAEDADAPEERPAAEETPAQVEEEETLIRIGDQTFKTQAEAIAYAERLENEKLINEAYHSGIRETLAATQKTAPAAEPEEDKFDEEFYANPKETLKKVQASARDEALAVIRAEQRREQMWSDFFRENPDLDGQRRLCEMTLQENWETIGKMTDIPKASKLLATKVRGIFQDYNERQKPRTELKSKPIQGLSPSGAPPRSVTPEKKTDGPVDFVTEMKRMSKRA